MTERSLSRVLAGIGVLAAVLLVSPAHGQQGTPSRVKLSGREIEQMFIARQTVIAGVNHLNDCVFLNVSIPGGGRDQFWYCNDVSSGRSPGIGRLVGDELCVQYERMLGGQEYCWSYYRIGEDKYEGWERGKHVITFWRIK